MPIRPDFETLENRSFNALQLKMKAYERQVNASLVDSLDQIRVDMSKIYEKYAVNGELSYADMARYNRLSTMQKSTIASLDDATRANIRTFNKLRPELYNESFYRYAWAIDQDAGVRLAWGVVNKDVVLETLASEYYQISLDVYGPEARATVRRALNDGLRQGKSYTKMMRDIRHAFDITSGRAMRIVRTEGQTAMNAGQQDLYTRAGEKGIEGREIWDATLDGRTRPDHQIMDGQAKRDDGLFHLPNGETAPFPAHQGLSAAQRIHCRCRSRFQIDEYPPQLRRSREGGVLPYQDYETWDKAGRSTAKPVTTRNASAFTKQSNFNGLNAWTKTNMPGFKSDFQGLDIQHANALVEGIYNETRSGLPISGMRSVPDGRFVARWLGGEKTIEFNPKSIQGVRSSFKSVDDSIDELRKRIRSADNLIANADEFGGVPANQIAAIKADRSARIGRISELEARKAAGVTKDAVGVHEMAANEYESVLRVVTHETAHAREAGIYRQSEAISRKWGDDLEAAYKDAIDKHSFPSDYSVGSSTEWFAESYTATRYGEGGVSDKVLELIKRVDGG
jgi:hypothetical protein